MSLYSDSTRRKLLAGVAALAIAAPHAASAGGLIGNFFREAGNLFNSKELRDLGDGLDGVNRTLKQVIPLYGPLEEAGSKLVHQLTSELGVEVAGPILAGLIRAGIEDAERGELRPLPAHVRQAMARYYPADILDKVRWRSGYGSASLQAVSLQLGDRAAMVLDYIIVFEDGRDIEKLWLVAHELAHVVQYSEWGIDDFAKRYVRNYGGVEAAADRMADEWQSGRNLTRTPRRVGGGGGGGSTGMSHRMYQMH